MSPVLTISRASLTKVHRRPVPAQPVAEQDAVDRCQHQAFRSPGCGGNSPHIRRTQPMRRQMLAGAGAREDLEAAHQRLVDSITPQAMRAPELPVGWVL